MSCKYVCSIYESRPKSCVEYPWNLSNQIFEDCQFLNSDKTDLIALEDLEKVKTKEEINQFCIECGKCCFFGPAACHKLTVIES